MLINAQTREELRVAIVDGDKLEDFQIEVAERGSRRGNIYRGRIAKIEPSLNAAFIDYGAERHGFLPIQDVVPEAWYKKPKGGDQKRPRIEEVLENGKPIVVQVSKDAENQKGAALTTNLSLAGRYLVLTPFDDTRGISRKVEDEETRKQLKEQVGKLDVPEGCGVIVRTNALGQNKTNLARDLSTLLRLWKRVGAEARSGKGVKLIYSDQDLILQALRDYLDPAIQEILVDEKDAYSRAEEYLKAYMPRGGDRLQHYTAREPLFSRYDLEPQIDRIYERRVYLPSGGSLVIDRTEALTAIDVNSGRSTGASTQAQTALKTNLEAAEEVARQLRLRDIGGLLVVDFIDMRGKRNQRKVEKALRDAMKPDKARVTVGKISDNGLLEINRQRIHQALALRTHRTCPTCDGTGSVPSPEMVGLNLLRRIEARAATAPLARVRIALHPQLAEAVQNGRRQELAELEREYDMRVDLVASPRLNLREQEVEWEKRAEGDARPSTSAASHSASVKVGDLEEAIEDEEKEEKDEKRKRKGGGRSRKRGSDKGDSDKGDSGKGDSEKGDSGKGSSRKSSSRKGKSRKGESGKGDSGKAASGKGRGGSRKKKGDGRGEGEAAGGGDGKGSEKKAGDEEGRGRRRSGGRRRAGSDAGDRKGSGDGKGSGETSGGRSGSSDEGSGGGGRRRRRRRRRTTSRKSSGSSGGASGDDRSGGRDGSDQGGSSKGGSKGRSRRRRRRPSGDESGDSGS